MSLTSKYGPWKARFLVGWVAYDGFNELLGVPIFSRGFDYAGCPKNSGRHRVKHRYSWPLLCTSTYYPQQWSKGCVHRPELLLRALRFLGTLEAAITQLNWNGVNCASSTHCLGLVFYTEHALQGCKNLLYTL